ncbi:CheR family methyltransferase [Maridesulfovibrio sp.]|uniref:CheR family methyltransferase n=1 Tax=Maridesulfovibrio sp. TaxID=2795000 RepID=UPI0029C9EA6F|nr:CheR family methyltransferase [Maridesulfovibrio sp.]
MDLEPFYKILNRAMGLAPDSLARSGVKFALKSRMRETGCDEREYLAQLRSNDRELSEFIEEVVVPETWFFRDRKPFDLLFETAMEKKNEEFRVLSAPCSTGEESYSIAMTLMGAGLKDFRVDGVDISKRALHKAKAGIYSDNSFRSEVPLYAKRWFSKCSQGHKLAEDIRNAVSFHSGNIIEGGFPQGRYDAIFCRNLMIYLDEGSRKNLAELLSSKLRDDGLLFVGHSEILPVLNDWFTPVRKQGTFALRKGRLKVAKLLRPEGAGGYTGGLKFKKIPYLPSMPIAPVKPVASLRQKEAAGIDQQAHQKPVQDEISIDEIKLLADRGDVSKALNMCEKLLQRGPDPELFHLCALLHESEGNIAIAEEFYGKVLYLEPDHVEALVHYALLLENRGDSRKAEIMRNRTLRAEKRNEAG